MVTSLLACRGEDGVGGAAHVLAGYESGTLALWRLALPPALLASCALSKQPLLALALCPARGRGVAAGPRAALLPFRLGAAGGRESGAEQSAAVAVEGGGRGGPATPGPSRIERRARVPLPSAGVNCLALRSDGRLLALGAWDGRVRVFAYPSLRPLASLAVGPRLSVDLDDWSEGCARAKPGVPGGRLGMPFWTCFCLSSLPPPSPPPRSAPHPLLHHPVQYHTQSATCLAFGTPASGLLATGSRDGSIALYVLYPLTDGHRAAAQDETADEP